MKIGFPRALFYFDYFPFWFGFFRQLGIEVVTSPPTNRKIMELGLKAASDETCLPIKLLSGHIQVLKDVDAIFLPRIVSVEEATYCCPKFLGIPESLSLPAEVPVLTVTLNWRKGEYRVIRELEKFGDILGRTKADVYEGYLEGQRQQRKFNTLRCAGWDFEKSIDEIECSSGNGSISDLLVETKALKIALVGHSYLTQETYANLNLLKKLREKVEVELIQHVEPEKIQANQEGLRKKLFWSHAKQIFGACNQFIADKEIDGIIYLTCFGCGTDSMVQELLARRARESHKPYMVITLDEHSGEAGVVTRLEAFLDMVERRKGHEGYLSTYG